VDKNLVCAGNVPCYQSIQAAVNAAQAGDTIYVFPGTYEEGVNLSTMGAEGDITLITVDASGNPTPGTVTVDNQSNAPEIYTGSPPFGGDVTIDGFVLRSEYSAIDLWVGSTSVAPAGAEGGLGSFLTRDVEIRNVDASHTGGDGISVMAEGNVSIKDCTTNDNQGYGIGVRQAWGDVTITGCTSNDNKGPVAGLGGVSVCPAGGICVGGALGQVTISNSTANGNGSEGILVSPWFVDSQEVGLGSVTTPDKVTITDSTTNGNGADGVFVGGLVFGDEVGVGPVIDGGDVIIENCTANGNHQAGFDPDGIGGTLSVQACIARDNHTGVDLYSFGGPEAVSVNGSIICGNECGVTLGGLESLGVGVLGPNLEGNWWGCPDGPEAAACDPICEPQTDSIALDFTPWISKVSASATVDPVNAGEPTVVSFQFSGGPPATYLGKGPGDLHGDPTFLVTTDNGVVTSSGFIGDSPGTLEVTLTPAHAGTATVYVDGPCGLDESIVLGVVAAQEEFVPEPGSVMLLGSGLVGLAGYAALRLRSGQGPRLRKR
jgi:hypothetical protein